MMELPKRRATSLHGQPAPTDEQCDLSQHLPVAPVGGSPRLRLGARRAAADSDPPPRGPLPAALPGGAL